MAEEDDFDFKDEEDAPTALGGVTEAPEVPEEPPQKVRRGLLRRLLPIGALLIALAAAGLYFTLGGPEQQEEPAEPTEAARQPIPIAPRPVPAGGKPVLAPVAEEKETFARPEQAEPAPERGVLMEVIEEGMRTSPAVAPEKEDSAAVAVKAAEAKAKAEGARYTLGGGAYLLESSRREAEEKVRRLGFSFRVEPLKKKVGMTRLRVGTFAPDEVEARLEEVKEAAPDAFQVREGDKAAIYAASYFDLDKARRYADELYEKGISVEEEKVQIELSLALLTYGAFPDRDSALQAAARAEEIGLETQLLKSR